ncbi:unnamed protein product [Owenia fusiformis]|uniref:G-protein coupled receptors family 1 profile domain-containing protein n=1 Tax=Owenia fusiformis TaxID=6347 RepID=A0A8S4NLU4_OWEFU|nr:unnamed protein product [Owenia fusiformis]
MDFAKQLQRLLTIGNSTLDPPSREDNNSYSKLLKISLANVLKNLGDKSANNETSKLQEGNGKPHQQFTIEDTVLIVAYIIIVIVSLFGNMLVCYVIMKNKRMRTVTNMMIMNLAAADITITILNIPFNIARHVYDEWPFGNAMCKVVNFSLMVSVYVSTFTLTSIALDRHQVIMYPLKSRISLLQGLLIIIGIWTIACILALPFALFAEVEATSFIIYKVDRCKLNYPEPSVEFEQYLTLLTIFAQYCLPLCIITIAYSRIAYKLYNRRTLGDMTDDQHVYQTKVKKKTIKMLIMVVLIFALCWMPLNLYHILTDFHHDNYRFRHNSTAFFVCHWIAMSSVGYNPFIYCWLNDTFRAEVKSRFNICMDDKIKKTHPCVEGDSALVRPRSRLYKGSRSFGSDNFMTKRTSDPRSDINARETLIRACANSPRLADLYGIFGEKENVDVLRCSIIPSRPPGICRSLTSCRDEHFAADMRSSHL